MRNILPVLILIVSLATVQAQSKVMVFIGEIEGPDSFMQERFKMLFMEEMGKLKCVELVSSKEDSQYQLSGTGRVDYIRQGSISGSAVGDVGSLSGSEGDLPNAILSVKMSDSAGRIVFVGNKSQVGGVKGSTHEAVITVVKDLKRQLKWK